MDQFRVKISVLDYGAGNLGSVLRALKAIGQPHEVIDSPLQIEAASAVLFPGVGSADQAMKSLKTKGNDQALLNFVQSGKPLLGICVGMQVLCQKSAEGPVDCLGIFPFELLKFEVAEPVPHMGWNTLLWNQEHESLSSLGALTEAAELDCYFVHSFFASAPKGLGEHSMVLANTHYAGITFPSFIAQNNVWGMQFHVEKSGQVGLGLLRAFCKKVSAQC